MQHDILSPTRALLTERIAPHWRRPLQQLALALAVLLAMFARDWAMMAGQWWDSSTYNHILLLPPIIGWLIWQRADQLALITPQAFWPGLVPLAGALLIWLLGDVSGLATASSLGAVAMVPATVLLVLGVRVAFALTFPLVFTMLLVPIGDELVPALQMITAAITIALTHASGIPAVIDGVFIDTPVGLFEVAEACSGVKFLVAMVALGLLVAHLCFRSRVRQAVFMAFAIVLPILANGVRAWGTIYIAQFQGIAFAQGFDHIFYGWVFFALVMAILLGASWKFFDRAPDEQAIDGAAIAAMPFLARFDRWQANGWQALGAVFAIVLAIAGWAQIARATEAPLPLQIALPDVPGWTKVAPQQAYPWQPRITGADRIVLGSYRDQQGRVVDVVYALYATQADGREAGAFGEGALPPDTEWRWLGPETVLTNAMGDRLQAMGVHQRVAATVFRHGEWAGGSAARLKLLAMQDRIMLRARPTAMLILSAEDRPDHDGMAALRDFGTATGGLPQWMDRVRGID